MHAGSKPAARKAARLRRTRPDDVLSTATSAWQQAKNQGIDVSLLAANLRKTPAERLRQHARALATVQALRDGMRRTPDIILASQAPRRRELLTQLDVAFRIVPPCHDERRQPGEAPAACMVTGEPLDKAGAFFTDSEHGLLGKARVSKRCMTL